MRPARVAEAAYFRAPPVTIFPCAVTLVEMQQHTRAHIASLNAQAWQSSLQAHAFRLTRCQSNKVNRSRAAVGRML